MKLIKAKIVIIAVAAAFTFFLSNDFGLIDIEKTAIITALAIDVEKDEYHVSAQVAVPESSDKTSTENVKAQISGSGNTIGAAIKNLGDLSGWYPKLDFCNLIILGDSAANENVIKILDYFSKTLRIQDSAVVVQSQKTAKDLLDATTPLDNISSFALQKVLLKNPGFNRDVVKSSVKTFVEGYYSDARSSLMPLIKIVEQDGENGSGGSESQGDKGGNGGTGSSGGQTGNKTNGKSLFDPSATALFVGGIKVGELDGKETLFLNMLTDDFSLTTLELKDVINENNEKANYLLTVKNCASKIDLSADENALTLDIDVSLYCKISDQNSDVSDATYNKNTPLPSFITAAAESMIRENVNSLISVEKNTGCDILKIKERLYRFHQSEYDRYKDNYIDAFMVNLRVKVDGQK